jgi:hypothetical protein
MSEGFVRTARVTRSRRGSVAASTLKRVQHFVRTRAAATTAATTTAAAATIISTTPTASATTTIAAAAPAAATITPAKDE